MSGNQTLDNGQVNFWVLENEEMFTFERTLDSDHNDVVKVTAYPSDKDLEEGHRKITLLLDGDDILRALQFFQDVAVKFNLKVPQRGGPCSESSSGCTDGGATGNGP